MMKRILCLLTAALLLFGLCACGGNGSKDNGYMATDEDIAKLDSMYAGRTAYHGQMHDHANTGGTSDGHQPLSVWTSGADQYGLDFVAILDHKQTSHMYLDEWDKAIFIGGSEAGVVLSDRPEGANEFHYNMVFADPEPFEEVLASFPEFAWKLYTSGIWEGGWHFLNPEFSVDRFKQVISAIREKGGLVVIPHGGQSNPDVTEGMELYITDFVGWEVFYSFSSNRSWNEDSQRNYQLWIDMLRGGARVWAFAGDDKHNMPAPVALSTIYAEEDTAQSYVNHARVGDITAGHAGVRMCIGDTLMGSTGSFDGQRVVFSVGDFYRDDAKADYTYRVTLLTNKGEVFSEEMNGTEFKTFAVDADSNAKFYRVEVFNVTLNEMTALGNPIWNAAKYQ